MTVLLIAGDAEEERIGRHRPGVVRGLGEETPVVTPHLCSDRGRRVAERDAGKGKLHRRRAYTPAGVGHGTGIACGGSDTAGAASMPSRWIA